VQIPEWAPLQELVLTTRAIAATDTPDPRGRHASCAASRGAVQLANSSKSPHHGLAGRSSRNRPEGFETGCFQESERKVSLANPVPPAPHRERNHSRASRALGRRWEIVCSAPSCGVTTIAVKFDLKTPVLASGKSRHRLPLHRLDEGSFHALPNCLVLRRPCLRSLDISQQAELKGPD
jgi:hypothetical protein